MYFITRCLSYAIIKIQKDNDRTKTAKNVMPGYSPQRKNPCSLGSVRPNHAEHPCARSQAMTSRTEIRVSASDLGMTTSATNCQIVRQTSQNFGTVLRPIMPLVVITLSSNRNRVNLDLRALRKRRDLDTAPCRLRAGIKFRADRVDRGELVHIREIHRGLQEPIKVRTRRPEKGLSSSVVS